MRVDVQEITKAFMVISIITLLSWLTTDLDVFKTFIIAALTALGMMVPNSLWVMILHPFRSRKVKRSKVHIGDTL